MTSGTLEWSDQSSACFGVKGPAAAAWLTAHGIDVPTESNTWKRLGVANDGEGLLVARLGTSEFFFEHAAADEIAARVSTALSGYAQGVYPVLREDRGFVLGGEGVHDVLAQICNVNFAQLSLEPHPLIMTLMIGVAVLVVPEATADGRRYRIWCDPTFGPYLQESVGVVVLECGGRYTGASV